MPLNIEKTADTPSILLDEVNALFRIVGSSYPADVYKTYQQVLEWIKEFAHQLNKRLICELKFYMLNSASRKMMYEILLRLKLALAHNLEIHWYYASYDNDIKEIGEIFAEQLKIQFRFYPV
jgi:hypothetical protein